MVKIELKLLADVGLVGMPSVGKSTIISKISASKAKIAAYHFTTLSPNLGVVKTKDERTFVVADMPGLIEGASLGGGLGDKFLRHIERCRLIVHMVDMGYSGRDPYEDYLTINDELEKYGFGLENRPRILVATKMDEEGSEERLEQFKKQVNLPVIAISALTDEGIDELIYKCVDLLKVTPLFPLYDSEEEDLSHKIYTLEEDEPEFIIKRPESHLFVITGDKIEKYYMMTNISTDEGMMRLITHLRKLGVDDRLEAMGAQDGDIVRLCDFEFEYFN